MTSRASSSSKSPPSQPCAAARTTPLLVEGPFAGITGSGCSKNHASDPVDLDGAIERSLFPKATHRLPVRKRPLMNFDHRVQLMTPILPKGKVQRS